MNNKTDIIYFDNEGHIVEKEKATKAIIRELDEKGNLVRETFGSIDNTHTMLSDEEFDALMTNNRLANSADDKLDGSIGNKEEKTGNSIEKLNHSFLKMTAEDMQKPEVDKTTADTDGKASAGSSISDLNKAFLEESKTEKSESAILLTDTQKGESAISDLNRAFLKPESGKTETRVDGKASAGPSISDLNKSFLEESKTEKSESAMLLTDTPKGESAISDLNRAFLNMPDEKEKEETDEIFTDNCDDDGSRFVIDELNKRFIRNNGEENQAEGAKKKHSWLVAAAVAVLVLASGAAVMFFGNRGGSYMPTGGYPEQTYSASEDAERTSGNSASGGTFGPNAETTLPSFSESFVNEIDYSHVKEEDNVSYIDNRFYFVGTSPQAHDQILSYCTSKGYSVVGYVKTACLYEVCVPGTYSLSELDQLAEEAAAESYIESASADILFDLAPCDHPNDPWEWKGNKASWNGDGSGINWNVEAIHADWCWANYDLPNIKIGIIDTCFVPYHDDISIIPLNDSNSFSDSWGVFKDHGTIVAGVIGATHNNGKGLAGICENCTLYGISKYEGNSIGSFGVRDIETLVKNGAKTINLSLGFDYCDDNVNNAIAGDSRQIAFYQNNSAAISAALSNIIDAGYDFVLIESSGNYASTHAELVSFFSYISTSTVKDRIIIVGAAQRENKNQYSRWYLSNSGSRVDVMAPGKDIYSPLANGKYRLNDGTSMAAPHVTAVCASVWAANPSLSGADVKRIVVETADIPVAGSAVNMINMRAAMERAIKEKTTSDDTISQPMFDYEAAQIWVGDYYGHRNNPEATDILNIWEIRNDGTMRFSIILGDKPTPEAKVINIDDARFVGEYQAIFDYTNQNGQTMSGSMYFYRNNQSIEVGVVIEKSSITDIKADTEIFRNDWMDYSEPVDNTDYSSGSIWYKEAQSWIGYHYEFLDVPGPADILHISEIRKDGTMKFSLIRDNGPGDEIISVDSAQFCNDDKAVFEYTNRAGQTVSGYILFNEIYGVGVEINLVIENSNISAIKPGTKVFRIGFEGYYNTFSELEIYADYVMNHFGETSSWEYPRFGLYDADHDGVDELYCIREEEGDIHYVIMEIFKLQGREVVSVFRSATPAAGAPGFCFEYDIEQGVLYKSYFNREASSYGGQEAVKWYWEIDVLSAIDYSVLHRCEIESYKPMGGGMYDESLYNAAWLDGQEIEITDIPGWAGSTDWIVSDYGYPVDADAPAGYSLDEFSVDAQTN